MKIIEYPLFQSIFNNIKLDIFFHGYLYADKEWNLSPYLEPCHRLYYITDGSAYIYRDDQRIELKKDHIYILPRRQVYGLDCQGKMEKFFVHFTLGLVPGLDVFDCFDDYLCMPFYSDQLKELPTLAESNDLGKILMCKSIIWDTISRFIQPHSEYLLNQANKMKHYKKIYDYIENNCQFGIKVSNLADIMNVSPSYLSRRFKKEMGITVKDYVNIQILDKAKQQLIFTDKTIKEIALSLNFCDEFYFSNYFKRYTNHSPKLYRQQNNLVHKIT